MLATVESSYGCDAEFYDRRTGAFQSDRLRIIDALPLRVGDVVLDVGCGTGLCFEVFETGWATPVWSSGSIRRRDGFAVR